MFFPFELMFDVLILSKEKLIKVPVKLKSLRRIDGSTYNMSVDILRKQKDYLELIDSLRPLLKSNKHQPGMGRKKAIGRLRENHSNGGPEMYDVLSVMNTGRGIQKDE